MQRTWRSCLVHGAHASKRSARLRIGDHAKFAARVNEPEFAEIPFRWHFTTQQKTHRTSLSAGPVSLAVEQRLSTRRPRQCRALNGRARQRGSLTARANSAATTSDDASEAEECNRARSWDSVAVDEHIVDTA